MRERGRERVEVGEAVGRKEGGDDLSGSAPANVRGQPWLFLNHTCAVDARRSGKGENRRMKRSPFQRCLSPARTDCIWRRVGPQCHTL